MLVRGGRAFIDGVVRDADILLEGARIARIAEAGELAADQVVDAAGCIVAPGFIDVHFHGCVGRDFCDGTAQAIADIARYEASRGVTAICPATMTYPEERLAAIMDAAAAFAPADDEAALVGVNMEGPFISPNKVGAQNPAYVQHADASMLRRLQKRAGGLVKIVDVAPEEPGALDFIADVAGEVRVSLAHTCATYDDARAAFEAGARQLTHLFNAMPGLDHREPGPIAAAAEHAHVTPELIADGVHVHPAMVRLAFALFGADRMILISDSMRACGSGDGTFDLGGQDVHVSGNRATLADGTIAGSVTDLAACVRVAVTEMGIALEDALLAASANPARALGLASQRGSIAPGYMADLVLLDNDLEVSRVILRGKPLGGNRESDR
ncbi:MAG: N-acetylglucosamine-6-phosphate deacetylase [Eggerthellaceae bacterium]|nr:N-acetylglucosamine-6-phosphate deacetylase [Eggerthellaceae bacterium]